MIDTSNTEWLFKKDDSVKRIRWYNEEWGVGFIYPRYVDNEWEYWFVRWSYRHPSVAGIIRGGKRYNSDGTECTDIYEQGDLT